jgi:synaptobrevin family protein YKT6
VLIRGEKIDALLEKSQNLSDEAKVFYKKSKKLNSCCG